MDNSVKQEREKEEENDLPPWEQHATVINMPRFNYHATTALLERSHSGFLITCTMKREKSATKEAIDILQKFFNLSTLSSRDSLEFTDVNSVLKKSKKEGTSEEEATDPAENVKSKRHRKAANEEEFQNCNELASDATHELGSEFDCSASRIFSRSEPNLLLETEQASKLTSFEARENQGGKISNSGESDITEPLAAKPVMFSLVKLARNGLLFFSLPVNHFSNIVAVLTNIFQSMDSGEIKPPLWCHRILPVQATCLFKEEDLRSVVLKLVKEYVGHKEPNAETPLKFAVGCNRRGVGWHEAGFGSSQKDQAVESTVLGRNECLHVVAGAVKEVISHSAVDLQSPEMAVLVEVLPLTRVHGSCVAAVTVLPGELVNAKPRLCVKPLVSDATVTKRKHF